MSITATPAARHQLNDLREELTDLRQQLAQQRRESARLREVAADGSDGDMRALARSVNAEQETRGRIEDLEARERTCTGWVRATATSTGPGLSTSSCRSRSHGWPRPRAPPRRGWATCRWPRSPARSCSPGRAARSTPRTPARWSRRPRRSAERWSAGCRSRRRPRRLDVVPAEPTDAPSTPYVKELPADGDGPVVVEPGAVKPQLDIAFEDATANSQTIAGWVRIKRMSLADVPMLDTLIRTRLTQRLRQALEAELLTGTGETSDVPDAPGIVGLLRQDGVGQVELAAGELIPDVILDAATEVLVSGASPNVALMNPVDRASLLKTKTADGAYVTDPFGTTASPIWDVPFLPAAALPQGTAVVGDTRVGMALLVRQGAQILVSDQRSGRLHPQHARRLDRGQVGGRVARPAGVLHRQARGQQRRGRRLDAGGCSAPGPSPCPEEPCRFRWRRDVSDDDRSRDG